MSLSEESRTDTTSELSDSSGDNVFKNVKSDSDADIDGFEPLSKRSLDILRVNY